MFVFQTYLFYQVVQLELLEDTEMVPTQNTVGMRLSELLLRVLSVQFASLVGTLY